MGDQCNSITGTEPAERPSQVAAIINKSIIDPVGSPLVRVLFTKRMIAADFLGDPTGTELDMPSQTHRASGGLTAGSLGLFFLAAIALRVPSPPGSGKSTGE